MQIKTLGLVLKESRLNEKDRYITILTPEYGRIEVFCKGVSASKGHSMSGSRLLCYSDFVIFENGGKYTLNSCELISVFGGLEEDLSKMCLAQYFLEFTYHITDEDMESKELLRLVLNSLYILAKTDKNVYMIKAVFELRAMSICGYMPDIDCCAVCGDTDLAGEGKKIYFSISEGVAVCGKCADGGNEITGPLYLAMRHILCRPVEKIFSFRLPEDSCRALSDLTESFAAQQLDYSFKTLKFFKEIKSGK